MVYINSFNAVFSLTLVGLLSGFVIITAYFWVENLEERAEAGVEGVAENITVCECLQLVSNYKQEIILYNDCSYNFTIDFFYENTTRFFELVDEGGGVLRIKHNIENASSFEIRYGSCSLVK